MHYYKFNIGDWHLGTSHLSLEEEATYLRLINYYYDTECPIPTETHLVFRRLRFANHMDIAQQVLEEFFTKTDAGWVHGRCDFEIQGYHDKADANRKNGKLGGRPKKNKDLRNNPDKPSGLNSETQTEPKDNLNYELLTTNQEPNKTLVSASEHRVPAQEIADLYNQKFPEMPQVQLVSEKRRKSIKSRWKEHKTMQTVERWADYFDYIRKSDFLMGRTDSWGGITFDWIINQANMLKIIEGNYHAV